MTFPENERAELMAILEQAAATTGATESPTADDFPLEFPNDHPAGTRGSKDSSEESGQHPDPADDRAAAADGASTTTSIDPDLATALDAIDTDVRDEDDPIEQYEYLKRHPALADVIEHPTHGRVLAVAYAEVKGGTRKRWFNCRIGARGFFEIEAIEEYQRQDDAGRYFVKLIRAEDGLTIRRWVRDSDGDRDLARGAVVLRVSGDRLVVRKKGA